MKRRTKILLAIPVVLAGTAVAGFHYFEGKFFTAPENRLTVKTSTESFAFEWGSQEAGGRTEPHAFQFVPVKVAGIDGALWMQFDLGAPTSVLYRKQLQSLSERGAKIEIQEDENVAWVNDFDFDFEAGSTGVSASALRVIELGDAIDWEDSKKRRVIGTLGADWIDGHVLVTDYTKQRIELTDAMPERLASLPTQEFSFRGRRVFLPAEIDGEAGDIWFDNGSSAFQLIVDEGTAKEKAKPGGQEEIYEASSWGEPIQIHNLPAEGQIRFGETVVLLDTVTWIDWPNQWLGLILPYTGLGGMSGNKLFLGRTLVLDTANQRFAVSS